MHRPQLRGVETCVWLWTMESVLESHGQESLELSIVQILLDTFRVTERTKRTSIPRFRDRRREAREAAEAICARTRRLQQTRV